MGTFSTFYRKSAFALIAVQLFLATLVSAQVAGYRFSQSTGSYTALASPTTVHASGWDDASVSVTIPFSFTFNGTAYTSCYVNSNGYIVFGGTSPSGYTPISSTTAYAGVVAAFARDLISNSSTVVSGIEGTSPNRVFVIQWNNARRYSGGAISGDVLNFQIRLYETSNLVEVRYGTCTATNTSTITVQTGLRGSANTDYSDRTINGTSTWATTDLGQSNAATLNTSNTFMPSSGLTFTWTPASCTIPTTITVPATGATTATVNWTAASPAPGSGYNWKVTAQNSGSEGTAVVSGSVAAGITTASVTGLSSGQSYAVYVRANCGSSTGSWNGPVNFTTPATSPPNCATLNSPANAATSVCYSGNLTWTAPASGPNPTGYKLYFGTDGSGVTTPTNVVNGTNLGLVTTYAFSGLTANTTYYWQIKPTNGVGDATGCTIFSFTTNPAPETTTPVSDDFEGCPEWTFVNGTQTNKWVIGTATNNGGSKAIYVSNDNGVTNNYSNTSSIVHFYRDITVPAGNTDIKLSFDWKGVGESTYDRILVYTAPTSVTPTTSTPSSNTTAWTNATLVGTYNQSNTYNTVNVSLPGTLAGTTFRLIFTWHNDGGGGSSPAGAIDNISLTAQTPQVPGCINAALPATGTTSVCPSGSLTWAAPSSGGTPTGYKLYLGTDGGGVTNPTSVVNGTNLGLVTSYTFSALAGNTTYYWKVVPTNAVGDATGCPIRSFTTAAAAETTTPVSDDFEGPCPEWTLVNGTQTNKWVIGTATNNGGSKAIYVSNDNGVTNNYSNISSVVHFYRDVTIPAGNTDIKLSFDWKGQGESTYDRILVYTAPTSVVPNNSTPASNTTTWTNATLVGTYNLVGSYNTVNVSLPGTLAGTTFRLIFTWHNDGGGGSSPAGAIDNINLTAVAPSPPGCINAALPATGATGICANTTLSWSAPSSGGTPTGYKLYVGTDGGGVSTPTNLVNGTNLGLVTNYALSNLAANTTYYWQVVPTNAIGDASGCPIRNFTTVTVGPETTTPVSDDFEGCQEWVLVNGSQTNKWVIGSATNNGGSKSIYISNDNGVTNTYSSGASSIVHFYRDITVPAGYTNITLSFDWKGQGESSFDRILVYTAPTSVVPDNTTPASNTTAWTNASLVGTYNLSSTFATATATLPAALAGTTFRLIFTWHNDGSLGTTSPAGAIDNVSVIAQPGPPSITYTALAATCSNGDRTLTANISSVVGVPTTGGNVPRIYFKKNAGAYVSAAGTLASGNANNGNWNFTISSAALGGLTSGDAVSYYVIAQDVSSPTVKVASNPSAGLVATGVNTVTTPPTTPNTYGVGTNLGGTYTVGAGGDFATLTAAINAFNTACLTGAVVFELTDASYSTSETFPITINSNSYASAVNTLTIRPALGANPVVSGAVDNLALLTIKNNYTIIDGSNNGSSTRNLTFTNTSTTYPDIIALVSTGTTPITNITVKNMVMKNDISSAALLVSDGTTLGDPGYFNNITIQNNDIQKSYVGVFATAVAQAGNGTNLKIQNNLLNASAGNANGDGGIYVEGVDGAVIASNNIGNFETAIGENDYGIWCGPGATNTVVEKNIVHDLLYTGTSGYGAKGIVVNSGLAAANITIRNNMIYNITGDGDDLTSTDAAYYNPVGIYVFGSGQGGVNIYYNTIYLYGNTLNYSSYAGSIGIALDDNSKATIKNNIIRNELGRVTYGMGAYAITAETSNAQFTAIDYNDYYVASSIPSGNYIGRIGSTDYSTLATFKAASGGDVNSQNLMPSFVSSSDLHMVPGLNVSLNNLGTTIAGITSDIDGEVRGASPDMGADEFTPVALDAAASVLISPSGSGFCGAAGQNVTVQIANYGTTTLTSIPVTVTVSGPVSQVLNGTYTGSLPTGASTNFTVGTINMNASGGTYIFNAQTNLSGDQNTANDAMPTASVITINPQVNTTVTPNPVCAGATAVLNATTSSPGTYVAVNSGASGNVNLSIPDGSKTGATSAINVTGTAGTVSAATVIKVTLNIAHTYDGDLDVFLVDPSGTRAMELTTDNGGSGDNYTNTVLLTGAATSITSGSPPYTGTFAPEGTVSTAPNLAGASSGTYAGVIPASSLLGAPTTGNWTLRVFDDGSLISGTLTNWSIEISNTVTGNFTHAFSGPGTISSVTYSGANNATGEVTLSNLALGTATYTVVTTGPGGCATSKTQNVNAIACTNTWEGDVAGDATNWFNPGNWSLNYVPNVCGANVYIPTSPVGGVFPVINATSPSVGDVTVDDNANITINAGKTLTLCGNWTGGGSTASQILGAGAVVLTAASPQQLSGKTQFQNLQLNNANGATLQAGSRFEIFGEVALQSGTLSTGSGLLIFRSTSDSQIGIIDNFSPGYTGTISGSIRAERYYHNSNTYNAHLMGSPVSGALLSSFGSGGTTGYAIPTSNCSETQLLGNSPYGPVASMDESAGAGCGMKVWKFENTASPAQIAKGYSVNRPGTGVFTVNGAANLNASYSVNGLNNSGWAVHTTLQGRPLGPGWHLISNPYLANLDISSTPAGFDVNKMVWINDGGPTSGSYQPATVVAPFQAFVVRRSAAGAATYTINASQRTKNAASYNFQKQGNDHELTLTAINNGTQLVDITRVAFNTSATANYDTDNDCIKMAGALDRHTLYTYNTDPLSWLAINALKSIEETSTVNVGFEPGITGNYTFHFDGLNSFDPTSYITLEDKKLNVFHDVRSGDYNFTANANDNWNRFVLHFTPAAKLNTTDATCSAAGQINIEQPGTANWNYVVTNSSNVTISSGNLNNSSPVTVSVPNGTYTVTLTDNNNYTVVKNVLVSGAAALNAAMNVSKTTAEEGEVVEFTNASSNAASAVWEFGDGSSSAGNNATHSYSQAGVYNVKLTVSNIGGCVSSTQQTVTVTSKTATGINNLTDGKVAIWSHANTVFVDFSKAGNVDATIDIYNILGQVISSEKFGKASVYSRQLNNLDAGYVLVSVKHAEGTITKKVFITNNK